MIVIRPLKSTFNAVWVADDDNSPAIVCRNGIEAALNIKLPKDFIRAEIDVEVTRFEYE